MKPITRSELDSMTCQVPGCDHSTHGGPMAMNSRCHFKAGSKVAVVGNVLHIHCVVYNELVVAVKVQDVAMTVGFREIGGTPVILCPTCGDDAPTFVVYDKGCLHVECKHCHSELALAPVDDDRRPIVRRKAFLRGL